MATKPVSLPTLSKYLPFVSLPNPIQIPTLSKLLKLRDVDFLQNDENIIYSWKYPYKALEVKPLDYKDTRTRCKIARIRANWAA